MRSVLKGKKGQLDFGLVSFVVIVFGLFLISPLVLKIINTTQATISPALGNLTNNGGSIAQANFNSAITPISNFWDKIVVFAFFVAVILLMVSGFFIDTNPAFIILFVFLCFGLILFVPNIFDALNNIYNASQFTQESAQLSFVGFLISHFAEVLVGLMFLLGVIIYGKVALFPASGGVRR